MKKNREIYLPRQGKRFHPLTYICTFSSFITWISKCSETTTQIYHKQNQSLQPENSKITEKLFRELSPVRIAAGKQMQACLQSDLQEWTSLNFQRGFSILHIQGVLLIRTVANRRVRPSPIFRTKKFISNIENIHFSIGVFALFIFQILFSLIFRFILWLSVFFFSLFPCFA